MRTTAISRDLRVTVVTETYPPEINGIAVRPHDNRAFIAAATLAAADLERLRRYGANARTTAETISWDRVIDAVETSMCDVIQRHRRGRWNERLAATLE